MKKLIWALPLLALVTACGKADKKEQYSAEVAPVTADIQEAAAGSAQQRIDKPDVSAASNPVFEAPPAIAPMAKMQTDVQRQGDAAGQSASGSALKRAPGVDGSIAPSVAFNYRYTFSLAGDIIPDIQEEHAAMCAKLGADKCRVTSILFEKQRDGSIAANLALKLDRAVALRFGRDATDLVKKSEGALETSQVVGSDAGGAIENNAETADEARALIAKSEARLRQSGVADDERQALRAQIVQAQAIIENLTKDTKQQAKSLVLTPMVFTYEVSDTVLGVKKSSPVGTGIALGGTSFSTLFGFLAIALGVLAPWLLLGGFVWWGVRKLIARRVQPVAAD